MNKQQNETNNLGYEWRKLEMAWNKLMDEILKEAKPILKTGIRIVLKITELKCVIRKKLGS